MCTSTVLVLLTWSALRVTLQRDTKESMLPPGSPDRSCIRNQQQQSDSNPASSSANHRLSCTLGFMLQGGVCLPCPRNKFSLANWISCQPLLGCYQIQHEIIRGNLLHSLVHWQYYQANWNGYAVIYATFNTLAKSSVDYSNLHLFSLSPSPNALYPIGSCEEMSVVVFARNSTFMEVGNNLKALFTRQPECDTCMVRLHLAVSYVKILVHLHSLNTTLCNSRTLQHLLSQFMIAEDYSFVLATLDNLPQDTRGLILCQRRELTGKFVAPEQRWPHGTTKIFNPDEQPKYNKMADIWKVPDVVSSLLTPACGDVVDYFSKVHLSCKSMDPHLRPAAAELLRVYIYNWDLLY